LFYRSINQCKNFVNKDTSSNLSLKERMFSGKAISSTGNGDLHGTSPNTPAIYAPQKHVSI
jgi:hypothetical protein